MKDINKLSMKYTKQCMQLAWIAGHKDIDPRSKLTEEEMIKDFDKFYKKILHKNLQFKSLNLTGLMVHSWLNVQRIKESEIIIVDSIKRFIDYYGVYYTAFSLKRTYYRIDTFFNKQR